MSGLRLGYAVLGLKIQSLSAFEENAQISKSTEIVPLSTSFL